MRTNAASSVLGVFHPSKARSKWKAEPRKMDLTDISLRSWKYCDVFWREKIEGGDSFMAQNPLGTTVTVCNWLSCLAVLCRWKFALLHDPPKSRRLQIRSPMRVIWILKIFCLKVWMRVFRFRNPYGQDMTTICDSPTMNPLAHLLAKKTNV